MEIQCLVYQYTTLYVTPANLHKHMQKICSKTVANLKTIIAQMDRLCTNSLIQQIKYPLLFRFGFFALSLFLL